MLIFLLISLKRYYYQNNFGQFYLIWGYHSSLINVETYHILNSKQGLIFFC